MDNLLDCVQISGCGDFEFTVPFEGCYVLKVQMSDNCSRIFRCKTFQCKPVVTLNNVGVEHFIIE